MAESYDTESHEHEGEYGDEHVDHDAVGEAPSDYEFSDESGATADVEHNEEILSSDEKAPRRSPLLPIIAVVGGVALLGSVAWWQFGGHSSGPAPFPGSTPVPAKVASANAPAVVQAQPIKLDATPPPPAQPLPVAPRVASATAPASDQANQALPSDSTTPPNEAAPASTLAGSLPVASQQPMPAAVAPVAAVAPTPAPLSIQPAPTPKPSPLGMVAGLFNKDTPAPAASAPTVAAPTTAAPIAAVATTPVQAPIPAAAPPVQTQRPIAALQAQLQAQAALQQAQPPVAAVPTQAPVQAPLPVAAATQEPSKAMAPPLGVHGAPYAPQGGFAASGASNSNAAEKAQLDALNAHINELQAKLDRVNQQLSQVMNMAAASANPVDGMTKPARVSPHQHMGMPAHKVAEENTVAEASPVPDLSPEQDMSATEDRPIVHHVTKHVRKHKTVTHHTTEQADTSEPASSATPAAGSTWVLRAATPGHAWLATSMDSHDLKAVQVGDKVAGIGQVTDIQQQGSSWVVRGTRGTIH